MAFGKIVKTGRWYPSKCETCGWIGSSEECGFDDDDSGDSNVYCPRCGSLDTNEYEHDKYPFYYFVTDLISRFTAWRMGLREARYWKECAWKYDD